MATLTSTGNVNLTSATNWSPAQIPVDGDSLTINAGHTLTLDKDITLVNLTMQSSNTSRILKSGANRILTVTNRIYYSGAAGENNGGAGDSGFVWQITSGSLTVNGKHQSDPWASSTHNIFSVTNATLNLNAITPDDILYERTTGSNADVTMTFVRATSSVLNTTGRFIYSLYLGPNSEDLALFRLISGVTWTHYHTGKTTWGARQQICRTYSSCTLSITGDFDYASTINSVRWWNLRNNNVNAILNGHHLQIGGLENFGTPILFDCSGSSLLTLIGTFLTVVNNTQPKPFGCVGVGLGVINYTNQSIVIPAERLFAISSNTAVNISGLDVTMYGKGSMGGIGTYTIDANTRVTVMPGGQFTAFPVANIPVIVPPDPAPTLPFVNNVTKDVVYGYAASPLTGTGLIVDPDILLNAIKSGLQPTAPIAVERSIDDEKSITFSWPVSGATITGEKSVDNGDYSAVAGGISFLRTESGRHYYTLAYNASDRVNEESTIRYKMTDGTYTRYFNLRLVPPGITPQQIEDQLEDEFNTVNSNISTVGLAVVDRPTLDQIEASTVLAKESTVTEGITDITDVLSNIVEDITDITNNIETNDNNVTAILNTITEAINDSIEKLNQLQTSNANQDEAIEDLALEESVQDIKAILTSEENPDKVMVNQDFGGVDNLMYTLDGEPVADALIELFLYSDYVAGNYNGNRIDATRQRIDGTWVKAFYLDPQEYVVRFYRTGVAGPDAFKLVVSFDADEINITPL